MSGMWVDARISRVISRRHFDGYHFNALLPVWTVIFGYVGVSLLLLAIRGKGLPMWPTMPRFLWTFMIALLAFGALRNVPAYPFTLLFP